MSIHICRCAVGGCALPLGHPTAFQGESYADPVAVKASRMSCMSREGWGLHKKTKQDKFGGDAKKQIWSPFVSANQFEIWNLLLRSNTPLIKSIVEFGVVLG